MTIKEIKKLNAVLARLYKLSDKCQEDILWPDNAIAEIIEELEDLTKGK